MITHLNPMRFKLFIYLKEFSLAWQGKHLVMFKFSDLQLSHPLSYSQTY